MPRTEMLFFGRWGKDSGHFLRTSKNRPVAFRLSELPWDEVDAVLCPNHDGQPVPAAEVQEEGLAQVHHKDNWTALAFWDRSDGGEMGSNSVFFVHKTMNFDEISAEARSQFPDLFRRHQFQLRDAEMA